MDDDDCTCGEETDEHPCPYAVEKYGDYEAVCVCCPSCEAECARDI